MSDVSPALPAYMAALAPVIADVVADWAHRHGQPFVIRLDGPAGGSFSRGHDGPEIRLDAVEFCRVLSGRGAAEGLLTTFVPF